VKKRAKAKKAGPKEELQEALLWHKERSGVRCDLCALKCFVAKEKLGACLVRQNIGNRLYTKNFRVIGLNIDTVEKRPLYHFMPGAKSLSISGAGDLNWLIAHERLPKNTKNYSPEDIVKIAEKQKVDTISYTGYEPTIFFEYVFRAAKLAHRSNIKNIFVTNGLITEEAIKRIAKFLDAAVVNFFASADAEITKKFTLLKDPEDILQLLKQMKKQRIHIEVTNTIIPQIGDSLEKLKDLVEWVAAELAPTVPFHILQFHPDQRFPDLPFTPISTLEACAEEARRAGLRYVYIGNVIQPHEQENTYCYNCRELLIERVSGILKKNRLHNDRCANCGVKIDIVA
jgi:pyruvate formate lyase activating enzyme